MVTPSHPAQLDKPTGAAPRFETWILGIVIALAVITTLASLVTLQQPIAAAAPSQSAGLVPPTAGAPLLHDHSVVLRQDLPDESQVPGASIGAYVVAP